MHWRYFKFSRNIIIIKLKIQHFKLNVYYLLQVKWEIDHEICSYINTQSNDNHYNQESDFLCHSFIWLLIHESTVYLQANLLFILVTSKLFLRLERLLYRQLVLRSCRKSCIPHRLLASNFLSMCCADVKFLLIIKNHWGQWDKDIFQN